MTFQQQINAELDVFESCKDSDIPKAVESLEKVIAMYPDYRREKEIGSSRETLIPLRNNHMLLFAALGEMYMKNNDSESAIGAYETAWSLVPGSLVELSEDERKQLKSVVHQKILVPLNNAYAASGENKITEMAEREEKLFRTELETLLQGDADERADVWCDLGVAYHAAGDTYSAVGYYKRALTEFPGHKKAKFLLAGVYGTVKAFELLFGNEDTKPLTDSVLELFDVPAEIEAKDGSIEIKVDGKTLIKYTKRMQGPSKNKVAEFLVEHSPEFVETVSSYGLLDIKEDELVKVYSDRKSAENEAKALQFFEEFGTPKLISSTTIAGMAVNRREFVGGATLYDYLADEDFEGRGEFWCRKKIRLFEQAIDILAKMHIKGLEIGQLDETPRTAPDYFLKYQQKYLAGLIDINGDNYSFIDAMLHNSLTKRGVFLVDFNLRNVLVGDDAKIHPVDIEKRRLFFGESDLIKLLEDGLEFEEWDGRFDYDAGHKDKRISARKYLRKKRYLTEEEENRLIARYYEKARADCLDLGKQRVLDAARVHIHLFYVGWDERMKQETDDSKKRRRLTNRQKYHLLEAKVQLDDMIESDNYGNKWEKKELRRLRKDLDKIKLKYAA